MKLYYSHNLNPRVAVAVARFLKSPVTFIRADPQNPANTEAFRPLNPNALLPVLAEGERTLWETDAIACRLSQIAGSDFWREGEDLPEMIRWISWGTHHLTRAADPVYFYRLVWPTFMDAPGNESEIARGIADFQKHGVVLDQALKNREWLVGDRISYADFRVATALPFAEAAGLSLEDFANIRRWHKRAVGHRGLARAVCRAGLSPVGVRRRPEAVRPSPAASSIRTGQAANRHQCCGR